MRFAYTIAREDPQPTGVHCAGLTAIDNHILYSIVRLTARAKACRLRHTKFIDTFLQDAPEGRLGNESLLHLQVSGM